MKELWKIFCDSVKELFNDNWAKVKVAFKEMVDNIIGLVANFVKVVVNIFGVFVVGVCTAFGKFIDAIIKMLGE